LDTTQTIYANKAWNALNNGDTLYQDSSLTTPVVAGWYSYTSGARTSFQTNAGGVIINGPALC
jgi:hypothetical protein